MNTPYENPTPLHEWFMANRADGDLIWGKSMENQVMFVRDTLPLSYQSNRGSSCKTLVVNSHMSKSCLLPVYEFNVRDALVRVRGNFHDWKVSVTASVPLVLRMEGLAYSASQLHEPIHPVYCEGFAEDWVYGPYGAGMNSAFTIELPCYEVVLWSFIRELWLAQEGSNS